MTMKTTPSGSATLDHNHNYDGIQLHPDRKVWEAFNLKIIVDDMMDDPRFLGTAKFLGKCRFFWSTTIPTACCGHGLIFFNPHFFDSICTETRKTIVRHEMDHLILKHNAQGEGYDAHQSNIAMDHVINIGLVKEGFTCVDFPWVMDQKYDGMSWKRIYDILMAMPPELRVLPNITGVDEIEELVDLALDEINENKDVEEIVTREEMEREAEEDADEQREKLIGTETGTEARYLSTSDAMVPILDATYEDIFKPYLIDPIGGRKRTFMRPNRRFVAAKTPTGRRKLHLPGRFPKRGHANRLTSLVYALDVSGSITTKQARQFHQSVYTVKKLLNPTLLTVLFFDTKIVLERTFTEKQPYSDIRVRAGGGTNLKPVYRRTREINPEALIVFTDLMVGIPPEEEWDTIWLIPEEDCPVPANLYGSLYLIPTPKAKTNG